MYIIQDFFSVGFGVLGTRVSVVAFNIIGKAFQLLLALDNSKFDAFRRLLFHLTSFKLVINIVKDPDIRNHLNL
jgi:hypothetical protein